MTTKNRTTSRAGSDRRASAPPALPGYAEYFQDDPHPAAQPDMDYDAHAKGDPSAWAEDPHPGPYRTSPAPHLPGYHQEDGKAHPADDRDGRNLRASQLRQAAEQKAAKCVRIAQTLLGRRASEEAIMDKALSMMNFEDSQIDATLDTLSRVGGGFLADQNDPDHFTACGDDMLDDDFVDDDFVDEDVFVDDGFVDDVDVFADDAGALHFASSAKTAAVQFFASMDTDNDGFLMEEDWTGSRALFASIDTDGDGIVSRDEVIAALSMTAGDEDEDDEGDEDEGSEKEASLKAALAEALQKLAGDDDESEDDEEDDDESEDDEEESEDEDDAKKTAAQIYASLNPATRAILAEMFGAAPQEKEASPDDVFSTEVEMEDVLADLEPDDSETAEDQFSDLDLMMEDDAGTFALTDDTMLGEVELDEEDAALADLFSGKFASDDEDEDAEEDEDEGGKTAHASRTASVRTSQRPQPRKPNRGPSRLGNLNRVASNGGSDIAELESLWDTAPDVSDHF